MIGEHIRLAQLFARWVDASPDFERMAPTPLSAVCFRAHPQNMEEEAQLETVNARLMEAVNATGEIFISHTEIEWTLRPAPRHRQHAHAGAPYRPRLGTAANLS